MFKFLFRPFHSRANKMPTAPPVEVDGELDWMVPPRDVHNPALWDRYWNDQVSHDLGPPAFDLFSQDEDLIQVMRQCGFRRVLCAGSGISQEPRALAEAGLEVTALDLSPVALQLAQGWPLTPQDVAYFFDEALLRPGGRVEFVAGDLIDPSVARGPFDLIIERRTLQLFLPDEADRALDALAARLQPEGILFSHCHSGGWKPPQPRGHLLRDLFVCHGWAIWESGLDPKPKGRAVWLLFTTG
jgi:SAM-dependent methyltransferase